MSDKKEQNKVFIEIDGNQFEATQYIIVAKEKDSNHIHTLSHITSSNTAANILEEIEKHNNNIKEKLKKQAGISFVDMFKRFFATDPEVCEDCPDKYECEQYKMQEEAKK